MQSVCLLCACGPKHHSRQPQQPTGPFSSLVKAQQATHSAEGGAPDPTDDVTPRAASAGEDLRVLLEQEAQLVAVESRASMEESGHLSRKVGGTVDRLMILTRRRCLCVP